jgi:hypothetical protein
MDQIKIVFITLLAVFLLSACSNTSFSVDDTTTATTAVTTTTTDTPIATATPTATVTPTPTPTTGTCGTSQVVPLSITSVSTLSNYAAKYLYAPTTVNLAVSLYNSGNNRYAGTVQISYYDQGVFHAGTFDAPSGTNVSIDTLQDNGTQVAAYNYWYNNGTYFTAFFQDSYGAIVLSVTGRDSNNCLNGAVYYKNFTATAAPQSPYRKCWFIRSGPYECRADNIVTKSSRDPGEGYTLLGPFSGLPLTAAFK